MEVVLHINSKKMIQLKKSNEIFTYGEYDLILEDHPSVYAYTRTLEDEKVVIMCNLTDQTETFETKQLILNSEKLLLANQTVEPHQSVQSVKLKPYEARIYVL